MDTPSQKSMLSSVNKANAEGSKKATIPSPVVKFMELEDKDVIEFEIFEDKKGKYATIRKK